MPQKKTTRKKERNKPSKRSLKTSSLEGELVDSLPPEDKKIIEGVFFSGPLPPPDDFNKYPLVVQKAIVKDARAQMKHRHSIESKVVDSDSFVVKVGSVGTVFMYLLCIIGAIYLVSINKTLEGAALMIITSFAKSLVLFRSIGDRSRKKSTKNKDNGSRSTK